MAWGRIKRSVAIPQIKFLDIINVLKHIIIKMYKKL